MRVVAVGAAHHHPPPLPAVEPLAVAAVGPGLSLGEVALGAQTVARGPAVARSPSRSASSSTFSGAWQVEQTAPVGLGWTGWMF